MLITASIALFGVPALFYISSVIAFSGTVQRVGLEFDFGQPVRSPTADLLYALEGHIKDESYQNILDVDGRYFYFEAKFAVIPGNPDFSERDFDLSRELIERGEIPSTEFNEKLGVIRVLDSTGSVVGFRERNLAYKGSLSTMEIFGDGEDFGKKKSAFCKNISTGIPPKISYMSYKFDGNQQKSVFESCLTGGKVDVNLPVRLNVSNISHYGVYRFFLTQNLVDLMGAVPSGFQRYLSISPYSVLFPPSEGGGWNHFHVSGEKDEKYQIALDTALLESFSAEVGGYNYTLMKSIPGGTINFAIMSTALFNLVIMVILVLIYPWSMAVRKSATLSRYFRLREYPFTFVGIGFVGYVAFWKLLSIYIGGHS